MKVKIPPHKRPRIEMLPLIDTIFLLLAFFIYTMLSMAVHRGLPMALPLSSTAGAEKELILSVTIKADGSVYLDQEKIPIERLCTALQEKAKHDKEAGVLLFADRTLPYQKLFHVLDRIMILGIKRVSLQAEKEKSP